MLYQILSPRDKQTPSLTLRSCFPALMILLTVTYLTMPPVTGLLHFIPLLRIFDLLGVCILTVSQVILIKLHLPAFTQNY